MNDELTIIFFFLFVQKIITIYYKPYICYEALKYKHTFTYKHMLLQLLYLRFYANTN